MSDDRYANFDYSRLIAWDDRLKREWPLFEELFGSAPSKRILDLGSGTGEHARFLASKGFDVTGVDSSQAMLEKSRAGDEAGVRFLEGDIRDIASVAGTQFGAAYCIGNVFPHLREEDDLARLAAGLRRVLLPGAPFLLQMINYDRIEAKKERALPLTFLPDPDDKEATIILLRTMDLQPDCRVIFMPATFRQRSDRDPPIELLSTRRVEIRGWRRSQIDSIFRAAGFASVEALGSYLKAPFDPVESRDLILIAR
ncbi:MAG TPA: class I SAM-dependent methyltransferase [Thermoanaerobaculia bacterium]|jgi:glycine/sarcosine N-methyltransferase|nr:class I SAM-dependent methyltransferase [Thermoanaerobaculia bacterium]